MQKHVLLVDSDPESVDALSRILQQHEYRVSVARDGDEGLRLARELHPDCVVFDVDLDGLSGTLMYSRLRRNTATRGIPALVHSAVRPRYGTGIPVLRKTCTASDLTRTLSRLMPSSTAA